MSSRTPLTLPLPSPGRPGYSFATLALFWTLVIAGLSAWHYTRIERGFLANARAAADHSLRKDMVYRQWAAKHGGVYVPLTESTPPNPHLAHIPERDIATPSGRTLTLLNPAYMTRQVYEMSTGPFDVPGHITSLKLVNPKNAPDSWEKKGLQAFENGATEWSGLTNLDDGDGGPYLRVMRPFLANETCLKCHENQGYAVGDIRGGISVSIPWEPYREALIATWPSFAYGYGGTWLIGLLFLWLNRRRLHQHLSYRRQAEEQLNQRKKHLLAIFNGVNEAIILFDVESGEIIDFNTRTEELFGIDRHGPEWPELADILPFSATDLCGWVEKGQPLAREWQLPHHQGHRIWTDVSVRLENILSRAMLLITIRDIDARKRSELQAAELLQRLQKLASHLPGMIYQYRLYPDGRSCFPYSSDGIEGIYGVTPEQVAADASAVVDVLHPDDRESIWATIQRSATTLSVWHNQYRVNHPDGHLLWVEGQSTPERLADGSILWHGYIRDISAQKQADLLLERSEARYQRLFENLHEGFALHEILSDADGAPPDYRLLAVNPAFERITGLQSEDALGRTARSILLQEEEILAFFDRVAASGKAEVFAAYSRVLKKHIQFKAFCPSPSQLGVTVTDVTDREEAKQALLAKNAELERITYTVSHDLKSPLVTIVTFLSFLEQDLQENRRDMVEKDVAFMRAAAAKMERLIGEILDIFRIGLQTGKLEEVGWRALIDETLVSIAGRIAERGVEIVIPADDIVLFADRRRMAEIWQNLIDNAVKYMGEQTSPRVEIGFAVEPDQTVFYVRDNGQGIDPRHHDKVFGLFDKLNPSSEGTGLGLALVKKVVEAHQGRIWVESSGEGQGSCFRFTLPTALSNKIE